MKINIEYDDLEDAKTAIMAREYYEALVSIKNNVRSVWKYSDIDEKSRDEVEKIYEFICDETARFEI